MGIPVNVRQCGNAARLGMLLVALSALATAQQTAFSYLRASYYKVPAAEVANFRKFNMEIVNKARSDALASGTAVAWNFSEVVGWGTATPYNFVTTTGYEKPFELMAKPGESEKVIQKLGLKLTSEDLIRQMGRYRVRQTVSRVQGMTGDTVAPGEFLLVMYARAEPNKLGETVLLHRNIYFPLQAERIKLGRLKGYGFTVPIIPSGADAEYDFVSWLVLKDSAAVLTYSAALSDAEAFRKVHPDKDVNAVREMLRGTYRTVRLEVRHCLAAERK